MMVIYENRSVFKAILMSVFVLMSISALTFLILMNMDSAIADKWAQIIRLVFS